MDPGVVREFGDALVRNGGNIQRAYAETGPIEGRFAAKNYEPVNFEGGTDLGSVIAAAEDIKAAIDQQPPEVRRLFTEAAVVAKTDPKEAARLARAVDPVEVRAAYGLALQRAAHDPEALGEVYAGLAAIPDDAVAGEVRDLIDDYRRMRPTGGDRADAFLRSSVAKLGQAAERAASTGEAACVGGRAAR